MLILDLILGGYLNVSEFWEFQKQETSRNRGHAVMAQLLTQLWGEYVEEEDVAAMFPKTKHGYSPGDAVLQKNRRKCIVLGRNIRRNSVTRGIEFDKGVPPRGELLQKGAQGEGHCQIRDCKAEVGRLPCIRMQVANISAISRLQLTSIRARPISLVTNVPSAAGSPTGLSVSQKSF